MTEKAEEHNEQKPFLRSFTREDTKLLLVTILATAIANVITVVIIALAIILARMARPHPATTGNYTFLFFYTLVPAVTILPLCFPLLKIMNSKKRLDIVSWIAKWFLIAIIIFEVLFSIVSILAWVGFAAGIG
jgi:hypothetical protein